MRIAGFKKQTLIDYPGNISSVVFTQGCNLRCGFCHNPDLVLPEKFSKPFNEEQVFNYLYRYKQLLDAVCITGGEPTIHSDLPKFIERIKKIGLKVKLDSNGTNPTMLRRLIDSNLLDFIAMDIKHRLNFGLYNRTVGFAINKTIFDNIRKSVNIIQNSGLRFEFRTTVVRSFHSKKDVAILTKQFGQNFKIQNFNSEVVLNPELELQQFSAHEFEQLVGENQL